MASFQSGQQPDLTGTRPSAAEGFTAAEQRGSRHQTHVESEDSPRAPHEARVDTAIQDYEMQLSLLRGQNMRRLRMAREEEENAAGFSHERRPIFTNTEPRSSKRKLDQLLNEGSAGSGEDGIVARTTPDVALQTPVLETNPPRTDNHANVRSEEYNRPRSHPLVNNTAEPLRSKSPPAAQFTHREDEDRNRQGPDMIGDDGMTGAARPSGCPFVVLYRAFCSSGNCKCDGRIYQDQPHVAFVNGEPHLTGRWPVLDLGSLLATRNPTAFVVYRECYCGDNAETRSKKPPTAPWGAEPLRDIVFIISEQLQTAIQRLSLFAPDDGSYRPQHDDTCSTRPPSPQLSKSPAEYSRYFFYHHRQAIHQAVTTDPCGGVIKRLLSHLLDCPDPMFAKCDTLFNQGLVTPETLPWLFRPNEVLVCNEGAHVVAHVLRYVPAGSSSNSVELECWNWGYDGKSLRRKDRTVLVTMPNAGPVPITQLSAYPLRFADERTRLRLFERGNQFWALRNQTLISYQGTTYDGKRIYPQDTRCMIDYQACHMFAVKPEVFGFSRGSVVAFDTWPQEISASDDLSSINTMLLPPVVYGFLIREKKWAYLFVDNIAPVNWDKKAFDRLVLPQHIKDLVKALVARQGTEPAEPPAAGLGRKKKRYDLVTGKGGGLIMLLHGGSGTGKTLTVESLAEFAEMPLYKVTRKDIATGQGVERSLDFIFYIVQKWNCVLLLDEPEDVIGKLSYLDQEAVISVLFQTLEYYDGTLILTARAGVQTLAKWFGSKIQVALRYPALDLASRRKIWLSFLEVLRLDDERVDLDSIIAHIDDLACHEMNGWQIRSAATTARRLAASEKAAVAWSHFEQAISLTPETEKFVRSNTRE